MRFHHEFLYRLRAKPACAGMVLAGLVLSAPAMAQTIDYSSELNVPWGHTYRDENTPYQAQTRDSNGNRLIINGMIIDSSGSTLPGTLSGDYFSSQSGYGYGQGNVGAIGNQLNVITQGNWNTVIIDSTQINNGNQTVNANGNTGSSTCCTPPPIVEDGSNSDELNGEINLND